MKEQITNSNDSITLPKWLDKLIYEDFGASYETQNRDLVVLHWNREQILKYLGTYFPRSFAEAYIIFRNFFATHRNTYAGTTELSLFDFGCGTGGELVGFIVAVAAELPDVNKIVIDTLDGNPHALRCLEKILPTVKMQTGITLQLNIKPITIDDYYDLKQVEQILNEEYDFIITFKAICEFVTMQQFDEQNPYEHFLKTFLPRLSLNGIICIVDITTRNKVANEWLPNMMDKGAKSCINANLVCKNENYNVSYFVSHSRKSSDVSKVTWRMYKYGEL